jgi:hypothetical protein
MRKLFLLPAFLLGSLVVFQSCSKQSLNQTVAPMRSNIVNATIALNGSYQLPIENSGDVSISMQASHFLLSQTEVDSKSGNTVYKYTPVAGYTGTDEVVLSNTKTIITSGSSGCSGNHTANADITTASTSYITVKINITN